LQLGLKQSYNGFVEENVCERDIFQRNLPFAVGKSMLRLTKKSDYALMALKHLAEHPGNPTQSAKDMADAYHIPPPLLAKILQTMARSGLVISHAGLHGGYSLARPATEITAFEVIRSIEGPLFIASCTTSHGDCDLLSSCIVKEPLRKLNDTIRDLLNDLRISDLCDESKLGVSGYARSVQSPLVTLGGTVSRA
jgi:Rrf2 family protein